MIDVKHKIIRKILNFWKSKILLIFLKWLKFENHWVTITNAQYKMYFAYLFFNCWKFKFETTKLHF
jgi:hypothetical protein